MVRLIQRKGDLLDLTWLGHTPSITNAPIRNQTNQHYFHNLMTYNCSELAYCLWPSVKRLGLLWRHGAAGASWSSCENSHEGCKVRHQGSHLTAEAHVLSDLLHLKWDPWDGYEWNKLRRLPQKGGCWDTNLGYMTNNICLLYCIYIYIYRFEDGWFTNNRYIKYWENDDQRA